MKQVEAQIKIVLARLPLVRVMGQLLVLVAAVVGGALLFGSGVVKANLAQLPLDAVKSPIPLPIQVTLDCDETWNPSCRPTASTTSGGTLRTYFYIDNRYRGPANKVYTNVCTLFRLANGTHTARVYARDSFGNKGQVGPYRVIKCDRTGPTLTTGLRVLRSVIRLAPVAYDRWSGVATKEMTVDMVVKTWDNYTDACYQLALQRGWHKVRLTATDNVGNTSAVSRWFYCRILIR